MCLGTWHVCVQLLGTVTDSTTVHLGLVLRRKDPPGRGSYLALCRGAGLHDSNAAVGIPRYNDVIQPHCGVVANDGGICAAQHPSCKANCHSIHSTAQVSASMLVTGCSVLPHSFQAGCFITGCLIDAHTTQTDWSTSAAAATPVLGVAYVQWKAFGSPVYLAPQSERLQLARSAPGDGPPPPTA